MENIKPLDGNGVAFLWTQILLNFVKKEEGKGLSANDLTDELVQKIQSAGTSDFDGDYNSLINQPQINGIALTGNKSLEDLGITKAITDAIGNVTQISFEAVNSFTDLPVIGEVGVFYLVPNSGSENNNYDEYIWNVNGFKYELIGTIQNDIDLSNYYTKAQVDELISQSPSGQSDCAPVGTIISFMGVNAPTGYLKCDGTVYNISQYKELANHFKSNFGNAGYFGGNGSSTFAVPDLRGEFLRGTGTASRNTGSGANVGVHQDGTVQSARLENACLVNPLENTDTRLDLTTNFYWIDNNESNYNDTKIGYTTRPTNTAVLYCIKCAKFIETERKYVNDTPTMRLIAEGKRCYFYCDGKEIEKDGQLTTIPEGYRPIFDIEIVGSTQWGTNVAQDILLRVQKDGKVLARTYEPNVNYELFDTVAGQKVSCTAQWIYK